MRSGAALDQRHSAVAKEEAPAEDVSPVVPTAKADTKKTKHYKPKVFARHPTTTAMGTRWVMLKNLGTVREVSFPLIRH